MNFYYFLQKGHIFMIFDVKNIGIRLQQEWQGIPPKPFLLNDTIILIHIDQDTKICILCTF